MSGRTMIRSRAGVCMGVLCLPLMATGCHHRKVQPLVLPQTSPVPLDNESAATAVLPTPPKPKLPEVPVAQAATTPKKVKKQKAPKSVAASAGATPPAAAPSSAAAATGGAELRPVSEAAAATGSAAGIGALTAGTEQDPKIKQQAVEMIASNERRLSSLPASVARAQAPLVSKVRTFQRDAQQALDSGDAEGARTLATKGKLLLDEMLKSGS